MCVGTDYGLIETVLIYNQDKIDKGEDIQKNIAQSENVQILQVIISHNYIYDDNEK